MIKFTREGTGEIKFIPSNNNSNPPTLGKTDRQPLSTHSAQFQKKNNAAPIEEQSLSTKPVTSKFKPS